MNEDGIHIIRLLDMCNVASIRELIFQTLFTIDGEKQALMEHHSPHLLLKCYCTRRRICPRCIYGSTCTSKLKLIRPWDETWHIQTCSGLVILSHDSEECQPTLSQAIPKFSLFIQQNAPSQQHKEGSLEFCLEHRGGEESLEIEV